MPGIRRTACFFLGLAILLSCGPSQGRRESPADSITAAELRDRIFFLASDALEGRYLGSRGYHIAVQYAESQFKAAGLIPLVVSQGNRKTYLQSVPVTKRSASSPLSLVLKTPNVTQTFGQGNDFRWLEGDLLAWEKQPLQVVFAGYGIIEQAYGWDDFRGLSIENKAVLIRTGAPTKEGKPILPEEVHKLYASNYSWFTKMVALFPKKPAAIFLIPDQETLKDWESIPMKTQAPQIVYNNRDKRAFHIPCVCVIKPKVANAMFSQARGLPGTVQPGRENDKTLELENVSLTLNASFREENILTWNVIGVVEGTDPVLKSEYVAVTAHLDHLRPQKQGEIYPGSDDNASGSAGLIEIAQAAAMRPAKRSLIFILLTGEEEAAIGSRHFVSVCPVSLEKIVADINLDMIGRTDKASEKNRGAYAVGSESITGSFTRLIKEVNSRTVRWPLQYENPLGVSDNIVFDAVHIPAVNFYSGNHADVHEPTDTPDKIDYKKAQKISQLVYEITMELGNRDPLWK
jgi:hypothetical protein